MIFLNDRRTFVSSIVVEREKLLFLIEEINLRNARKNKIVFYQ